MEGAAMIADAVRAKAGHPLESPVSCRPRHCEAESSGGERLEADMPHTRRKSGNDVVQRYLILLAALARQGVRFKACRISMRAYG